MADWDYNNKHVQNDVKSGKFLSSKTTLIAFGPPFVSMINGGTANTFGGNADVTFAGEADGGQPMAAGLIQSMSLDQGRQIDKIFEFGSGRAYHIPGRVIPSFSCSKIMYSGPSMLKFAYNYYLNKTVSDNSTKIEDTMNLDKITKFINDSSIDASRYGTLENKPGYNEMFINFASEFFQLPIGILLWMKSSVGGNYGAVYLEDCYFTNTSLRMDVGANIIGENCSVEFDRIVPMSVSDK